MDRKELEAAFVAYMKNKEPEINIVGLNEALVEKQGVSKIGREKLLRLHAIRADVVQKIRDMDSDSITSIIELRNLAKIITRIDFLLQRLWKFPQDERLHRWFELPKCTCPKNIKYGKPYKKPKFDNNCVLHGEFVTERIRYFQLEVSEVVI